MEDGLFGITEISKINIHTHGDDGNDDDYYYYYCYYSC